MGARGRRQPVVGLHVAEARVEGRQILRWMVRVRRGGECLGQKAMREAVEGGGAHCYEDRPVRHPCHG